MNNCHYIIERFCKKIKGFYFYLKYPTIVLLFFLLIYSLFDKFQSYLGLGLDTKNKGEIISVAAQWLTAIATSLAYLYACKAFKESRKLRKTEAFSEIFTQLINNHKDIFNNKNLIRTIIPIPICKDPLLLTLIDKRKDVFSNFCLYFDNVHNHINSLCSISEKWNNYTDSLESRVHYCHCFKYLYHEIETVLKQNDDVLKEDDKRHYIGIIQSYLNYDELFCYLINLLQHFHNTVDETEKDRLLKDGIKTYGFFNDLEHEKKYKNIIKHLRDSDINISKLLDELINF